MKKALALIALSLALEAGFLFQIAMPARSVPAGAPAPAASVARTAAPRAVRS
jgi:hypothetical protein